MILNGRVINPGEMRIQITLQTITVVADAGGAQTKVPATLATVWSKWTNVHGSEVWAAQSAAAIEPATVLIRYLSGLDNTCLVLRGTKTYQILSIDNIGQRNEYMELKVQAVGAG